MNIEATLDPKEGIQNIVRGDQSEPATPRIALAALAHQIRNPLTVAGLQLHQLSTEVPDELQEKIDKVRENLRRIEDCLQNSLAFVGGEIKDMANFPAIQLNDEFRRVCAYTLSENALEWHCLIDDSVLIHGNRKALVSALLNLVDNAAIACGGGLKLCVVVSVQHEQMIIEVHDNGPGIPAKDLRRVKLPFVSRSRKKLQSSSQSDIQSRPGQGLGLAITSSVVNAHKGELVIMSDAGMGVNAVVRLPLIK
ncbi:MAG: HAMP domain-containing histidine kinase [Pseudomonadales bacterium]|nr:HAMP domain-containing histidine kinase [Pseudomonadales bacterium]